MAIEFERGKYYRMPVFFGPIAGPRQWPETGSFDPNATTWHRAAVNFLTEASQLEAFLPPGFALWGEPIVTLDVTFQKNIAWLAGRGYAMSDFKFPAIYRGKNGPVHGTFVLVRWENLTDPILTGRDELGHNKLYCKIPDLTSFDGRHTTRLSWLGHNFAEIELWDMEDASSLPPNPLNQGQLSFKYIPKTGSPGEADAAYATLSPSPVPGANPMRIVRFQQGKGRFEYRETTWEDFPFAYNVVNAIAGLTVKELRGASLTDLRGAAPYPGSDTRIVE